MTPSGTSETTTSASSNDRHRGAVNVSHAREPTRTDLPRGRIRRAEQQRAAPSVTYNHRPAHRRQHPARHSPESAPSSLPPSKSEEHERLRALSRCAFVDDSFVSQDRHGGVDVAPGDEFSCTLRREAPRGRRASAVRSRSSEPRRRTLPDSIFFGLEAESLCIKTL